MGNPPSWGMALRILKSLHAAELPVDQEISSIRCCRTAREDKQNDWGVVFCCFFFGDLWGPGSMLPIVRSSRIAASALQPLRAARPDLRRHLTCEVLKYPFAFLGHKPNCVRFNVCRGLSRRALLLRPSCSSLILGTVQFLPHHSICTQTMVFKSMQDLKKELATSYGAGGSTRAKVRLRSDL